MRDPEKRRASNLAYYHRHPDRIRQRRARAGMSQADLDAARDRDIAAYEASRDAVLERKRRRRQENPGPIREQARASYRRHAAEVKEAVSNRRWVGMEHLRPWRQAIVELSKSVENQERKGTA